MNRTLGYLRSVGMLLLMGGGLYALAGCGGTVSGSTVILNPTDTAIPNGQRFYVANHGATDSVLRFDQILTQVNGASLTANATFAPGFNSVANVSTDFAGRLLAADQGAGAIDAFNNAALKTGTVSTADLTFNTTAPVSVVFDSSNNVFYVASGGTISRFSSAGVAQGVITDAAITTYTGLAIDDSHQVNGNVGVLFAIGTDGGGHGVAAVYPNAININGAVQSAQTAHFGGGVAFNGVQMVHPTSVAYDPTHLQLWWADPQATGTAGGTGRLFRLDNADLAAQATSQLGGTFEIPCDRVAVDESSGFAAVLTMDSLGGVPNALDVFTSSNVTVQTSTDVLQSTGELNPTLTLTLTGVTDPVGVTDDSVH